MFFERLWVPHICPEVWVGWEHGLMSLGLAGLEGKVVAKTHSSAVKALQAKCFKGCLIGVVVLAKNNSTCFLLNHLNLSALVLGQTTVENRGSKFQS